MTSLNNGSWFETGSTGLPALASEKVSFGDYADAIDAALEVSLLENSCNDAEDAEVNEPPAPLEARFDFAIAD